MLPCQEGSWSHILCAIFRFFIVFVSLGIWHLTEIYIAYKILYKKSQNRYSKYGRFINLLLFSSVRCHSLFVLRCWCPGFIPSFVFLSSILRTFQHCLVTLRHCTTYILHVAVFSDGLDSYMFTKGRVLISVVLSHYIFWFSYFRSRLWCTCHYRPHVSYILVLFEIIIMFIAPNDAHQVCIQSWVFIGLNALFIFHIVTWSYRWCYNTAYWVWNKFVSTQSLPSIFHFS